MIKKRVKKQKDTITSNFYELGFDLGYQKGMKDVISLKGKKFCPLCKADLPLSRRK